MSEENQSTDNDTTNTDDGSLLDAVAGDNTDQAQDQKDAATPGQKPEWLSNDLWDDKSNTLKTDLALAKIKDAERHEKMAKDLRDKMARRGLPPEKPEDYKINTEGKEWSDKIALPEDVVNKVKGVAHKLGISQAQFGPLAEAYLEALATTSVQEPTEEDKAAAAEAEKERQAAEIAKLGANGTGVIRAVSGMIQELKAQGELNDAMVEELRLFSRTAAGVQILNLFRTRMGGNNIPMADIDPEAMGGVTHSSIQDLMNSDAYLKGDPVAVDRVNKLIDQTVKAGNPFKYKL